MGGDVAKPPHLLHVFSSFEVGGQQMRFVKIANRLGRRYRHTVVALDGRDDCRQRLDPELEVGFVPVAVEKARGISAANFRAFRRLLTGQRPDLLLTYNWAAVECALANRVRPVCPTLHFEDGFGPEEAGGRQLRRRVWFRRIALGGTCEVIVPSRGLERIALDVWRIGRQRVLYIPNGIDGARFAGVGVAVRGETAGLVVGSVGTLRPEKNFGRLIRAVAALPADLAAEMAVRLVLVGDGPERVALEALARELGIADRVRFTGALDRPETELGRFDLFALSSDTEQMPLGLLEAMAAGRAVVATDVGDVALLVAPENRPFIVPKQDEAAFVARMAELLRDGERRRLLGECNRRRALAQYDEAAMVAAYDRLFARRAGGAGS